MVAQSTTTTSARTGHLVVGRALIGVHWPRAHDATIGVVRMVMASSLAAVRTLIADILREDQTATAAPRICAAVTSAAPCEGAAVTIMTADSRRESLYASDPLIAQYQRAQLTLGEGPDLHAFTTARAVLLPDITDASVSWRWPILRAQTTRLPLGGVYCFPLRDGAVLLGVVTMYHHTPRALTPVELAWIRAALVLMIGALLATGSPATEPEQSALGRWVGAGPRRRPLDLAIGMLSVQLGVSVESAFARLRAHAYSEDRDITQLAEDIVHRRTRLEADSEEADPGSGT